MNIVSNRKTRQQVATQGRTLNELGAVLDSQAKAITGLAENQRVLHDGMLGFITKGFWARLRWVIIGA